MVATYEYILWTSIPAMNVWSLANTTLDNLQIAYTINTWKDIFRMLDKDYKDIIDDIRLIIKHNIVITTIYSLYASYKALTDLKTSGKLTDKEIDMYPNSTVNHFQFQLRNLIYLTPAYAREASKKKRTKQGTLLMNAREQAMALALDLGHGPLSTANEQLFAELWIPAGYVRISNKILTVRPMTAAPPHNPPMPAPP